MKRKYAVIVLGALLSLCIARESGALPFSAFRSNNNVQSSTSTSLVNGAHDLAVSRRKGPDSISAPSLVNVPETQFSTEITDGVSDWLLEFHDPVASVLEVRIETASIEGPYWAPIWKHSTASALATFEFVGCQGDQPFNMQGRIELVATTSTLGLRTRSDELNAVAAAFAAKVKIGRAHV